MKDRITSTKIDPATGRALPAGVEYRGKGQYRARKRIAGGERIHQTFSSAKLARRWLDTTSAKLELGQFQDTRPLERQTVRELVERYVREEMQARENDRKGHIPAILQDEIAQLALVDLTSTAVRGFRDRLADKYSAATVVKRLNLLAAICQHAIAEWDVPFAKNPAAATAVKRPAGADKKRNRRLVGDEYERLLEVMAKSPWPDDVAFVRFAIEQGTRREEALTLRWRDIDFDRHSLSFAKTKTMHRAIERGPEIRPLTPGAARLLRTLQTQRRSSQPGDLVFDIGSKDAFSVRFGRMTKKAGLRDLTFHDLRHEATSRLARIYTNPLELRRVTGHKDIKSLDRYYQPHTEDLAAKAIAYEKRNCADKE
ncbi:site-specific integrase [Gluconobacter sp. DsW_058]|uniref:integrase n=1 Tax=Gluconobacter sp. DsW_058 TaxID=1511210 RepID=UPI000A37DECF|nr:site-specific integrase [Gluconobacter sp. DsW_058]OUJ09208.1 DNA recombinase [Gluconobacter sp. DsW_058]